VGALIGTLLVVASELPARDVDHRNDTDAKHDGLVKTVSG
jgi:hypothetical protein